MRYLNPSQKIYFSDKTSHRVAFTTDSFFDRQLVWVTLSLMLVGLVMVMSASSPVSYHLTGQPFYFTLRHTIFFFLAIIFSSIVLQLPIERWLEMSTVVLFTSLFLLLFVLFFGHSVNGASRWISFGIFHLQPSEIAKLSLLVYMSGYLTRKSDEVRETFFGGFVKPSIVFSILAILLLSQPDLGTVVVMLATLSCMLFIAGARLSQFITLIIAGIFSLISLIIVEPYRIRRFVSFLEPWKNPYDSGYQLTQSLMAFGRGQWFGQGLGNSVQKLEYLPEAHSDFIFAILAEELGLIGAVIVLILMLILVLKALYIGQRAFFHHGAFSGHLASSIGFWFAIQTLVNVGAASGLMPTKGLTLPLISYGGSSLIIMSIAVAILLRIDFECRLAADRQKKDLINNTIR